MLLLLIVSMIFDLKWKVFGGYFHQASVHFFCVSVFGEGCPNLQECSTARGWFCESVLCTYSDPRISSCLSADLFVLQSSWSYNPKLQHRANSFWGVPPCPHVKTTRAQKANHKCFYFEGAGVSPKIPSTWKYSLILSSWFPMVNTLYGV